MTDSDLELTRDALDILLASRFTIDNLPSGPPDLERAQEAAIHAALGAWSKADLDAAAALGLDLKAITAWVKNANRCELYDYLIPNA